MSQMQNIRAWKKPQSPNGARHVACGMRLGMETRTGSRQSGPCLPHDDTTYCTSTKGRGGSVSPATCSRREEIAPDGHSPPTHLPPFHRKAVWFLSLVSLGRGPWHCQQLYKAINSAMASSLMLCIFGSIARMARCKSPLLGRQWVFLLREH